MTDWFTHRAIIALIVLVVGCIYMSSKELPYVFSGRKADATLIGATEERVSKRPGSMPYPQLRVDYQFNDAGTARKESDAVPTDWPVTKGQKTVAVEYLPGTSSSRLFGNDHKGWLWASGALVVLGGLMGGVWWKFRDAK